MGSVASGGWASGEQDDMPVRKRAAKSPEPTASTRPSSTVVEVADVDAVDVEEVARPAHPSNWLGGVLVEQGSITQEQLDDALAKQAESGGRLGEILIRDGVLREAALARGLAQQLDLPLIDLRLRTPQPEALALLPEAARPASTARCRWRSTRTSSTSRSTVPSPTPRSPSSAPPPT